MPTNRTLFRLATLAVAAAAAAGSVATASAQLPGVSPGKSVVIVDIPLIQVAVDAPDLAAGTVDVTLRNNTDRPIACNGIRGATPGGMTRAGTVTTAEIVARAVDYYATYPHTYDPALTIPVGSNGNPLLTVGAPLGSITTLIPGSVSGSLRPEFGAAGRLGEMYTAARLDGLVGPVSSVTVPAAGTQKLTVRLNDPAAGPRPPGFRPGAVFGCQVTNSQYSGQDFLFSGYHGDSTPIIPLGSITSSETGRFGS